MENIQEAVHSDVYQLERLLREKTNELQWKTDILEETRNDLAQARNSLYESEQAVEEERKAAAELRAELGVAKEATRRWEEEKAVNRAQQVKLQANYEASVRERDSLKVQARNARLENLDLEQKIQEFKGLIASKEPLVKGFSELRNRVAILTAAMQDQIAKLQQEQENLQKTVEAATKLNGRLQAAGMCTHAIQRKYKIEIKELQDRLSSVSLAESKTLGVDPAQNPDMRRIHVQMEASLKEMQLKLEDEKEIENMLAKILEDSTNVDDENK